jgi:uncharacterized phage-associated protein
MTVPVLAAAKRLGERSGWSLSNLEMQKLLYLAHMYCLGGRGRPLIDGHFEAWDYGPVHPVLYHRAKIFGKSPVENIFHSVSDLNTEPDIDLLDQAVEQLAHAPPSRLVAITHWDGGAWAKHYRAGGRHIVIPNTAIRQEFMDRGLSRNDAAA